jgi:hypothetical protein
MPLRHVKDALLIEEVALPNGATTAYTADFDFGDGEKHESVELAVEIPALALSELPNSVTLTAKVFHGAAPAPTTELATLGTMTGATGTDPSAAKEIRFRFPPTVGRYVRVGFVGAANVAASAKKGTASLVF